MVQQMLIRTLVIIGLLAGPISQKAYSEESTMLKSRLQTHTETQQPEKKSLLSNMLDSTNIYEYLLGNPDFAKVQDITIRLWDKHTNIRKYRTHMKDNFIQTD
ncbi:MAG: Unknown protein [uncultured Thiotrichaceae bacterium]|uniref:Uncharacterized protein n=1 Tax=uncultured Thiotrichaceae bacterium TaxID=298394 RepID=A0A6S6RX56_9GAMM|nr:MAG: Unknown protein [uncultured Thiotrichaceae bacterium]